MGVNWTAEQQKVIDLRNRNILVSAAAGSGKTAVLVERIITMLTDEEHPIDVDQLLIVTFTEAAAAEMKERIRDAIEKKLEEHPGNEHLSRQETLIHSAQITTIHSFCLSVIRDHFHAIDIDPGFRVGEEGELKLLKHDVLSDLLEEQYQKKEQRFLDFVAAYGDGKSDKKIEDLILKIFEYSRSYPIPNEWLKRCVDAYRIESFKDLVESDYGKYLCMNVEYYLDDALSLLDQGLELCKKEDGPKAYQDTLECDKKLIEKIKMAENLEDMADVLENFSWGKLKANRSKTVSEEKVKRVKTIREEAKNLIDDLAEQYFYQSIDATIEDIKSCLPAVEELTFLVREFAKAFEEKKRSQNMIDFSDMEQYALRILTEERDGKLMPSSVAKEYQEQYVEIMIDEYQDSNLIQEAILTSVSTVESGKYNVFMVGDVKQSIYRFRLSRPELFMDKFNTYTIEDSQTQRIDLHKNFRSRKEVLDSVNQLFFQLMASDLGGIDYDEQAALYVGASYPESDQLDNATEVLVIDNDVDSLAEVSSEDREGKHALRGLKKLTDKELEARAVAVRIRELMKTHQVTDKETGELRAVRYSDIVILTRSTQGVTDVFSEILSREGIPTYTGSREGYFATQEIGIVLDYLRVLDNMRQDIPLAAVLTSPIGGVTEEELAWMKSKYLDVPFWKAVTSYVEESTEEDAIVKCMKQIDAFRKIVPYTSIHELLWKILDETDYEDYVSAMPGGEQRKANLKMLVQKARTFESTSYKGLFHFVRYIEQLKKYNVDYGEANIEDEQSDTVRIMTIHKSKGLEFPIVFVVGMGKGMNFQDARSRVVLHPKLGIGLDVVDLERRTRCPSIIKKVIQSEETVDTLAEELRVLYVAYTRAKEKLIITGSIANRERRFVWYKMACDTEEQVLPYYRRCKVSSYWDWVLPAVRRLKGSKVIRMEIWNALRVVQGEIEREVAGDIKRQVLEQWDTERVYQSEMEQNLNEQFGYRYPYEYSRNQKLKFTVSELKKRMYQEEQSEEELENLGEELYKEPEVVPLIPKFLQEEEELTGALRGTAYHRVLELLRFKQITEDYGEDELVKELLAYVKAGKLGEDEAGCIRSRDILRFLHSTSGRRMIQAARAEKMFKEQPFVLGVDETEIYPEGTKGELVLVQGIIDVYFEEADGLVVLDYKTDKIFSAEELAERYHAQLDYYARALEQMTGKKVKEKIIYSFTLGKEIILK